MEYYKVKHKGKDQAEEIKKEGAGERTNDQA